MLLGKKVNTTKITMVNGGKSFKGLTKLPSPVLEKLANFFGPLLDAKICTSWAFNRAVDGIANLRNGTTDNFNWIKRIRYVHSLGYDTPNHSEGLRARSLLDKHEWDFIAEADYESPRDRRVVRKLFAKAAAAAGVDMPKTAYRASKIAA